MNFRILIVTIVTLYLTVNISGQQLGNISGQVFDELGAVVVGAEIIVIDSNKNKKTSITNSQGEFSITNLTYGKYTVQVTAKSFVPFEKSEIIVSSQKSQKLNVTLTIQSITETITIDDEKVLGVDADNNAGSTILKGKDLAILPDDPQDLENVLRALAGASAGSGGAQFYIDGFTGGNMPSKDAIREIRINQNPFSAEFEKMGLGRVEVFTKPGLNKLQVQSFLNFNDESLNARNPFAANRASTQTRHYGGTISGPIRKDKSSYFFSISNRQIDTSTIVNAEILDSLNNIIPFNRDYTVPTSRFTLNPRFDFQLNSKNALTFRYDFTRFTTENQGIGGTFLPDLAFSAKSPEHEIRITETAFISPTVVNETRFRFDTDNRSRQANNTTPTVIISGSFSSGGAQLGSNLTKDKRWEFQNYTTVALGKDSKHTIKFGVKLRGVNIADYSEANFNGAFVFNGVYDSVTNNLIYSSIEQYRQKLLGNTDPKFNPNQYSVNSGTPLTKISQYDIGFFGLDEWHLRQNLTISYGLRYENQSNIEDNFNFAPRFSFSWSPKSDKKQAKTVVRGGIGIFYERFNESFSLQSKRYNGNQQFQYIISDPTILSQPIFTLNGVTNIPSISQIKASAIQSATIYRIGESNQSPYSVQTSISIERQLWKQTQLSLSFINSRYLHLLRTRNINAPICNSIVNCDKTIRPDPTQGNIYQFETSGVLNQKQLIVDFNMKLKLGISAFASYRLGFAKSNTDGADSFPVNSYDLSDEYGSSLLDIRHNFSFGGTLNLPWKFELSPLIIATSGTPFNITTGIDSNGDSIFAERPTYASLNKTCLRLNLSLPFCNLNNFQSDPEKTVIPRNFGRSSGFFTVNLNMNRAFTFGGTSGKARQQNKNKIDKPYKIVLGMQIANLFNKNNRGLPISNLSSSRFGQSNSTVSVGNSVGSRKIDLQIRFVW